MLYYEIKKVFSQLGNKIALFILGILIVVVIGICVNSIIWVNEKGEEEKGFHAIQNLKSTTIEWAGPLTEEKISQVIEENARINKTMEAQSDNVLENNKAYGWKQGFKDIRELINLSFCEFREYNYYKVDSLTAVDAANFYSNRLESLKRWLKNEAEFDFTKGQKEYLINKFDDMKIPLEYAYMQGWRTLFENVSAILMIMSLIIGVIIAPIFSSEGQLHADSVFYASYYGRSKAVAAKIKAGFLINTIIYCSVVVIFTCIILSIFGVDGANNSIQASGSWKSFYNITNFQVYLLIMLGGYVGCSFMAALTMFVSVKSKSTVFAAIIPFILIFIPWFLDTLNIRLINKFVGLLPDQLMQMDVVIRKFNIYEIDGKVVGALALLFIIYIPLTLLLQPAIYLAFHRSEVR